MSILQVTNASFSYEQHSEKIFEDISFEVGQGEIFCLLGPNGCGKSTLLDNILGVNHLQRGEIRVMGRDTRSLKAGQIARYIAYVPQSHERTFPYQVIDIVKMGRAAYTGRFSSPSAEDKEIAKEALDLVGLRHLRHRPYTQLSGGEGQLVMIARALAQKTPVIVMDEPTAHLDFKHEMVVMETIVKLVRTTDLTVVMATHFPNHTFYLENNGIKTTVALMHNKHFLEVGNPTKVLNEHNMRTLYNVNTKLMTCPLDTSTVLKQLVPVSTLNGTKKEERNAYVR